MTIKKTITKLVENIKYAIDRAGYQPNFGYDSLASFTKFYPYIPEDMMTPPEKICLTLPEKIYFMEKEIHRLRCELPKNDKQCFYTRDQTYRLCVYKKELAALKNIS